MKYGGGSDTTATTRIRVEMSTLFTPCLFNTLSRLGCFIHRLSEVWVRRPRSQRRELMVARYTNQEWSDKFWSECKGVVERVVRGKLEGGVSFR